MYYIGIDLGGTNIAAAVVDENYKILGRGKIKTNLPRPAAEILADMADAAKIAVNESGLSMTDIKSAGVGAPGSVNLTNGVIEYANNIKFENVEITRMMGEALGVPCFIENDANCAALGELASGAMKGYNDGVMITLGTGLGGGIIIGGRIYSGPFYNAAEVGHHVIVAGGEPCTCGRLGCFEAYAAVTGLIREAKKAAEAEPGGLIMKLVNGDVSKITGEVIYTAKRVGDPAAVGVIERYINYIAEGSANLINIFRPGVFVVGGGISALGDELMAPLKIEIEKRMYGGIGAGERDTKICAAVLGNNAGIIGAAMLGN